MDGTRVKLTSKVKRGLVLARTLTLNALSPDEAPGFTTVRTWTRKMERELNAALAWMEQVEADLAAKAEVLA
jgi:hypothetical protein